MHIFVIWKDVTDAFISRAAMETDIENRHGEGEEEEGGMFGENNMETCTLPYVKYLANENLLCDSLTT